MKTLLAAILILAIAIALMCVGIIVKGKFPGLECACVGTDEKMLVYLTDESKKELVKEELVSRLKLVASSFEVRIIAEIPKNEAGKTLYAKLENK